MHRNYAAHSPMSDPGEFLGLLHSVPGDARRLSRIVQGLLVHSDWLSSYGLGSRHGRGASRETLPAAERLRRVVAMDDRPVTSERPPEKRCPATCRDFALMLVSFLRSKGIPARLRCGFASYLGGGWEDHWISEYWEQPRGRRLADPQIDEVLGRECGVGFDPMDLPDGAFMSAGEAWLACRAGRISPDLCGHGPAAGWWFLAVNVVRDHYAVNNRETSPWDGWRDAGAEHKARVEADLARYDHLADLPGQPLVEMRPFWL